MGLAGNHHQSVSTLVAQHLQQIWWVKIESTYYKSTLVLRIPSVWMNIHLTFDESLKDVFSALCKDIQKRLGRGKEEGEEELEREEFEAQIKVSIFLQRSPSEKKSLYFFTYFYQEVLLKKIFIFLKIFLWRSATQIRVSIFLHIFWSRRDTEIKVSLFSKNVNQGALLILNFNIFSYASSSTLYPCQ